MNFLFANGFESVVRRYSQESQESSSALEIFINHKEQIDAKSAECEALAGSTSEYLPKLNKKEPRYYVFNYQVCLYVHTSVYYFLN